MSIIRKTIPTPFGPKHEHITINTIPLKIVRRSRGRPVVSHKDPAKCENKRKCIQDRNTAGITDGEPYDWLLHATLDGFGRNSTLYFFT